MKVQDVMTPKPKCCGLDTNLAAAIELLCNNDCGILPVIDDGKLSSTVTDRDICIALGTRNRLAAETVMREVATRELQTCSPDDDVDTAMAIMSAAKAPGLVVVDHYGGVAGIVALNDIVLTVGLRSRKAISEPLGASQTGRTKQNDIFTLSGGNRWSTWDLTTHEILLIGEAYTEKSCWLSPTKNPEEPRL